MKDYFQVVLWALALLAGSGCVKTRMMVLVREDGSGIVTVNSQVSKAGLDQLNLTMGLLSDLGLIDRAELQRMTGLKGNALGSEDAKGLLSEEALRAFGTSLGPDVKLLRHQPTESADWMGASAVFMYPDIRQVHLGTGTEAPVPGIAPWNYRFTLQRGTPNALELRPPELTVSTRPPETALDKVLRAMESVPGLDRLFKKSMAGGFAQVDLQLEGCVAGGNAQHLRGGNTITLADVRADEIDSGTDLARVLSVKSPRDLVSLHRMKLNGVRLQDPSVPLSIRFQPCP